MGDARLLRKAQPVPAEMLDTAQLRDLIQDMLETMESAGGVGLAAPQIGVDLRLVIFGFERAERYPDAPPVPMTVLLNPVLEPIGDATDDGWEGCLSVPGLWHDAIRYPWAKVVGIDLDGEEVVLEGEGLLAQALQHETDHLDGMLYLSRLPAETRREAMRQVRESDWF